jgi:hypothetical protein
MIRLAKALVFLAILVVGGAGAAAAVEVDFGSLIPSPGGCSTTIGDSGSVCANTQSFSAAGNTFTATGFETFDDPAGGGALTLKPMPANTLAESGLGENNSGPGTPCTSADCAIDSPFGVAVVASGNPMNDAIIGSVGEGDTFNFFTGSSIAGLSFFGMFDSSTCMAGPAAGTCLITFPDAAAIGIQTDSGSVLLTAVSANAGAVPEPSTWAMLLLGFAGLGFVGYRKARPTAVLAA